ncbi:glycosyltransferase family 2 protein [Jannaschia sp. W003]|uniref:glycosyltransferase family 2 protein n=1 Tax=Jannaschia sp. W003 TaxID=2867012 RepID=UPI0021A8E54D|nr:galactosyltransferase-related protein [Jannaschia sp. W003]UWQ21318.1 glycosyltransferase [Jannaschia sp. W003]
MTHPATSVLTLASGRAEHLANVVRGLRNQTEAPLELVVGVMQDDLYDLPETDFPIRQIRVGGDHALPLAAARNAVAREARGEVLAFVDVDCIPAPTLVADYARQARAGAGCFMGEVMYLPGGANAPGWTYRGFDAVAEKHSDRAGPPEGETAPCTDYRCFWSLNFAIHREDFARSGGFDERYQGYGGEDTDFGKTLDHVGLPISWVRGAKVYHQYHPHAMPPVHHMDSVIANAERFRDKWGYRTMEHWLYAFELMGLIEKRGHWPTEDVIVLRRPNAADEALCRQQSHMPYANTTRVIRQLQERRAGRRLADAEAVGAMRQAQRAFLGQAPVAAE